MKRDLAYDKRMRRLSRILFFLVVLVTPVVMISYKYEFFRRVDAYSITFVGAVVLAILMHRFRNDLIEWINEWEYSSFKHILLAVNRVIVPVFIYFIVRAARSGAEDLLFVLEWITFTTIIGYFFILPIEKHYDHHVKRELRKQEMREVRDE